MRCGLSVGCALLLSVTSAMAQLSEQLNEKGEGHRFWREIGAGIISPATAFNRLAFDKRFDTIFASRNPAYYSRLGLGVAGTAQNIPGTSTSVSVSIDAALV